MRFSRRDLPQELRARLRQDSRDLFAFAVSRPGPFAEQETILHFKELRDGYATHWHDAVLYQLLRDLIAGGREENFRVTLEAWTEAHNGLGEVVELAFADEALAAYRAACDTSEPLPAVTDFLPEMPEGDRYEEFGAALCGRMLPLYRDAWKSRGGRGDPVTGFWNRLPTRLRSSGRHLYIREFCITFGLPGPGTPLCDGYTLETIVGVGGMGVVYRAMHADKFRVALKLMRPDCGDRGRFVQEGRQTVALTDRRFVLVKHTSLGDDAETPFFTMDYVEGGRSLSDLLDRREEFDAAGMLSLRAALDLSTRSANSLRSEVLLVAAVVRRVAEALHVLHGEGLLHCDVKPGNILLSEKHGPLLGDLGLARRLGSNGLAEPQAFAGTAEYASPEQAAGAQLDRRSDVYQLGAVLFRALTGRAPFPRGTADEPLQKTLARVARGPSPVPHVASRGAPADLEAICRRAMAANPAHRYDTAKEMADDLGRLIRGRPVQARGGPIVYAVRAATHFCAHSAAIWALLAALTGAGGYRYWAWREASTVGDCVASINKYRTASETPPPVVELLERSAWPSPDYSHVSIESTSVLFDLSRWRPVPIGQSPEVAGRVEPAFYTRVIDLRREKDELPAHREVRFQFRTGGYDVDLCCTTHPARVIGSLGRERLGGGTGPVLVREVIVDLSKVPLGRSTRIVLQGTIWNGFQPVVLKDPIWKGFDPRKVQWAAFLATNNLPFGELAVPFLLNAFKPRKVQWAAFLATNNLPFGELAVLFPPHRKPPPPHLFIFQKGDPDTEVPIGHQNFHNPPNQPWWVWRPYNVFGNFVYQVVWDWSPPGTGAPVPAFKLRIPSR